jgi:hypothetical protein
MIPLSLTTAQVDRLIAYCDLAVKTGGLNEAQHAMPLAQALLAAQQAVAPTPEPSNGND